MSTIDYNVDNYTIDELLDILQLEDPTSDEIVEETEKYMDQYSPENEDQPQMVTFFEDIQTKLLQYMEELEQTGEDNQYDDNEEQTEEWIENEALPQDDEVQKDKTTDRVQKIDVYDNNHVPMNREQLGINNNFNVPVAQDSLNPNLENITSRFINLDSQFRQAFGGSESISTDYTLDLSDPLTNVLSLRLYSIQIPYTWYVIDYIYGNTCFWVTNTQTDASGNAIETNTFRIFIDPGNYTPSEFCTAINNAFTTLANFQPPYSDIEYSAPFTYPNEPAPAIATFNVNDGKIKLNLDGWKDPSNNPVRTIIQYTETFKAETDAYFTFFDLTGAKSCYMNNSYSCSASSSQGHTFNGTLGWVMGFRLPIQPVFKNGNKPTSTLNLFGTKYFIVVLDDYNQNHINNGLISIAEMSTSLAMPSYYNTSQPYICVSNTTSLPGILNLNVLGNLSNVTNAEAVTLGINPTNFYNTIQDKTNFGSNSVQEVLPSAPRTLTQAQIYTINEISKTRNKTISFRSKAPTNSDTFAIIPIKYGSMTTGQLYTEVSGQFQDNKRIYFGPVSIDRMRIRLLDDKGVTIDLHGADWCITMISENLYQY
jgi:hypothetical protein